MSVNRRPFFALALAETLSLSGTRLSMIAIPWLVLTTTGDAAMTGLAAFAEMAPYVVAKGLGGPFIDRFGPRRIAIAGDLGALAAVSAIPVLHGLGLLHIALLLPIVFVMGLLRGPADAAKQALIPRVAEEGGLPLERVTGVLGTVERLATTIGAGAAGALVAILGAAPSLVLNALAFGLSALAIGMGTPKAGTKQTPDETGQRGRKVSYFSELTEGFGYLIKDPVLVAIVTMVAMTNLFDQAYIAVFLPVWAKDFGGGVGAFGLLVALFSGFSVLGAALAAAFGERLPRLGVYTIAFLITGAPRFLVFLPGVPMAATVAVLALGGFASGFLNPIISAVIFERIPRALTGRVSALISAFSWGLMPFGGLLGGLAVTGAGLPAALVGAGLGYFAATMLPLMLKSFRALDARPDPDGQKA